MVWFVPAFMVAILVDAFFDRPPGPVTILTLVAACLASVAVP